MAKQTKSTHVRGEVTYINPDSLPKNPAFTNVVTVTGPVRTVYVGGQDAVDSSGAIVGKGDLRAQTEQILKNIQAALAAGGAQLEHVVKWNIYVVQGQSLQEGFAAFQSVWGSPLTHPPSQYCSSQDWHTPTSWPRWTPSPSSRNRSKP
jgi:enamine deaminase RidA (YjgF/YER057c/UK114 family)